MPALNATFSTFIDGGAIESTDIVVGLRDGLNTRFNFSGVIGNYLPLAGGSMTGNINMGGNLITDLADPMSSSDAVNKGYVDALTAGAALSKTDDTNVTLTLGGSYSTALLNAASLTLGWTGQLGISRGGTGVSSVTIVPTASSWAGWDANSNFSANNTINNYATTATAASTTTLTVSSAYAQFFTGTTTQTVKMPVTSTLVNGFSFYIVNNSTGNVTIESSGANSIQVMAAGTTAYLTCINTGVTTAAGWNCEYAFNGGEGSGTVNSGTQYDLAYYATSGTAVSGLATANSSVLVTSSGGVPSLSTTLPSGLSATNLTLVTPTLGAATATSITFSPTTDGIVGTTTNDSASTGYVGEYVISQILNANAVAVTATATNLTNISLTAGDWDVWGNIHYVATTGYLERLISSINTTSATLQDASLNGDLGIGSAAFVQYASGTPPMIRISLSSTTTVYIIGYASISTGSVAMSGFIAARRVR